MSECGRWSRLLKKRELLAYYLLCREEKIWNIGEAVDQLCEKLLYPRKTVYSIIRRLRRIGLLKPIDKTTYKCIGFTDYFEELYRNYICRKKRRLGMA